MLYLSTGLGRAEEFFGNIRKLLVEKCRKGNAQVQAIWDSYRSHDGCDLTVHRGNDTICHPGLTQTTIHPLVGFVIHERMWFLGKLLPPVDVNTMRTREY